MRAIFSTVILFLSQFHSGKIWKTKHGWQLGVLILFLPLTLQQPIQAQNTLGSEPGPGEKPSALQVQELLDLDATAMPEGTQMPSLDTPKFETSITGYPDSEPFMVVRGRSRTRLYPLRILQFHPVVNDKLGEQYIVVTFSPLAGILAAYDAQPAGLGYTLEFEPTGVFLAGSDILWDRQTGSLWLQASGTALAGPLKGVRLERVPGRRSSFSQAISQSRTGPLTILSAQTGYSRPYSQPAYPNYDELKKPPFLWPPSYPGLEEDGQHLMQRVFVFSLNSQLHVLEENQIALWGARNLWIEEAQEYQPVLALRDPNIQSVYSFRIDPSMTGALRVFRRGLNGQVLSFEETDDPTRPFRDTQTGSFWNYNGKAIQGELEGQELKEVYGIELFRYAWLILKPYLESPLSKEP